MKSPYPHGRANPNRITRSLIAVLAGLQVPFLYTKTHELGEELVASMHLKPNTRAEFTQTIENEILSILRKQHGFQDEIVFGAPGLRNGSGRD